jgi:hypothetical protein
MRRLLTITALLICSSISRAQGGAISGQALQPPPPNGTGGVAPFATVRVCGYTGTIGVPCLNLSSLYSDQALTQSLGNPISADQYGNWFAFVAQGNYLVQTTPINGSTVVYSIYVFSNGSASVSSIGLNVPSALFSITPTSPITTSGTFNVTLLNQSPQTIFANCTNSSAQPAFCAATPALFGSQSADTVLGNCTNSAAVPTFCLLTANMIPATLNATNFSGNVGITGTLGVSGTTVLSSGLVVTGASTLGNVTSSGTISATGVISSSTSVTSPAFISATASPASTGVLRLANTDLVNWRNSSNTGDEGLGMDTSDHMLVSSINGMLLTGSFQPAIRFGGTTSSFPMIIQAGSNLFFEKADLSVLTGIEAATGIFTTSITVSGTTVNSFSGNTTKAALVNGTLNTNHSIHADGSGNLIDGGFAQWTTTSGCLANTGCTVTGTWPSAFTDTSYFINCTPSGLNSSGAAFTVAPTTTTTFTISVTTLGFSNPGGFTGFYCNGFHP